MGARLTCPHAKRCAHPNGGELVKGRCRDCGYAAPRLTRRLSSRGGRAQAAMDYEGRPE